jgi:outer membrane lipoprotein carrier protein
MSYSTADAGGEGMSVMKRLLVVVMMAVTSAGALRAEDTARDVLDRMKKKYDSIQDAQLRFSQRVKFEMAKIEQNVHGTLLVKKENKYRVELEGQTIVTNGETVWSYSQPNNQVLIDHFKMDDRSLSPERILTGAPEDFAATVVGREMMEKDGVIVLKLLPRDEQAFVRSMKLWVDDATWMIRRVELVDANGRETRYTVNDVRINVGIQDSRFTYQIPEGAEIVDLR